MTKRIASAASAMAALGLMVGGGGMSGPRLFAADAPAGGAKVVWTDPADPSMPADFKVQGEYVGDGPGGKIGAQVIALDNGAFQAVLLPGGLPGDGWDGKQKSLLAGRLDGDKAAFKPAEGSRKYLAQKPDEFSATSKFPPEGQKPYAAEVSADGQTMTVTAPEAGRAFALKKVVRQSPTMGAKPAEGAKVLFDGTSKDAWTGGRVDAQAKALHTDGQDVVSKDRFLNYTMHVEFMLPYRPSGRGQGRGNSGFYQVDQYEVQILDSFGLDGKNNECGGVYTKAEPKLNMCLPPLVWQTYDVEFTAAQAGPDGKKTKNARLTARLNGTVIHDDIEINGPTGGARKEPEGTPGPVRLQGHGNPVQFRNIWVVEKK